MTRIGIFEATSSSVFETVDDPVIFGPVEIAKLVQAARVAPTGRARFLLHADRSDKLHEMVIALPPDSCDHPHINFQSGKSFLALSGQFAVLLFSGDGSSTEPVVLSDGSFPGARMIRLREAVWHTIIPLAGDTVFVEAISGPFTGNRFAPWFPGDDEPEARQDFADKLREIAMGAAADLRS